MPSAPQFSPRIRDVRATSFDTFNRYWNDPEYRRKCDVEHAHARKLMHDAWDARLVATDNRFPSNWTADEKEQASKGILK